MSAMQKRDFLLLRDLLKKQNRNATTTQHVSLLKWIHKNNPQFPDSGNFKLDTWKRVGDLLQNAAKAADAQT